MNKKLIVGLSGLVLVILFVVGVKFYRDSEATRLGFIASENAAMFVREYSPVLGKADAKIILTEFLDPECESCRAFYPYVKELLAKYPDDVKLVIRYVPYHGNSRMVIKILEAARKQGKYWETLELLFHYQPSWGDHHRPRPELIWTYLNEIQGLNIEKLKEDMVSPEFEHIITQDFQDAEALGVRGTPTFFVNGQRPQNFGLEYVQALIEQELKK